MITIKASDDILGDTSTPRPAQHTVGQGGKYKQSGSFRQDARENIANQTLPLHKTYTNMASEYINPDNVPAAKKAMEKAREAMKKAEEYGSNRALPEAREAMKKAEKKTNSVPNLLFKQEGTSQIKYGTIRWTPRTTFPLNEDHRQSLYESRKSNNESFVKRIADYFDYFRQMKIYNTLKGLEKPEIEEAKWEYAESFQEALEFLEKDLETIKKYELDEGVCTRASRDANDVGAAKRCREKISAELKMLKKVRDNEVAILQKEIDLTEFLGYITERDDLRRVLEDVEKLWDEKLDWHEKILEKIIKMEKKTKSKERIDRAFED